MTEIFTSQPTPPLYNTFDSTQESLVKNSGSYQIISDGEGKAFICSVANCKKVFRYKSAIQRHFSSHTKVRPFICTFQGCQKAFKRVEALDSHVRGQHTGEATFTCFHPGCGMNFTTSAKLRYHTLLHSEEKSYKCSVPNCGKLFMTNSQLKQHEASKFFHSKLQRKTFFRKGDQSNELEHKEKVVDLNDSPVKKIKTVAADDDFENCLPSLEMDREVTSEASLSVCNEITETVADMYGSEQVKTSTNQIEIEEVLSENKMLKKELVNINILISEVKQEFDQIKLMLPQDIQKLLYPLYESDLYRNEAKVEEIDFFLAEKAKSDSTMMENFLSKIELNEDDISGKEYVPFKDIDFEKSRLFPFSD